MRKRGEYSEAEKDAIVEAAQKVEALTRREVGTSQVAAHTLAMTDAVTELRAVLNPSPLPSDQKLRDLVADAGLVNPSPGMVRAMRLGGAYHLRLAVNRCMEARRLSTAELEHEPDLADLFEAWAEESKERSNA